jgi:novobiocin biosynthesis protein NovU/D-mycarose 3-C-methyltransferase
MTSPDVTAFAAELVRGHGLTAADLVVEVGSGDGGRLRAVRALGPRVLGVEPDVLLMARAFAQGVDTIAAYFGPALADYVRRKYGPVRLLVVRDAATWGDQARSAEAAAFCLAPEGRIVFDGWSVQITRDRAA